MGNEKLEMWLGFAKFLLGTVVLGLVTTLISNAIQQRELEIKEQEQVAQFLEHALQEDVNVRRRFAQYFATVTRSDALRRGWEQYSKLVEAEYEAVQAAEAEKQSLVEELARAPLGSPDEQALNARIAELERVVSASAAVSQAQEGPPPRVYIHIREESQREAARRLAAVLSDGGLIVPGIERLDVGPRNTELRYFRLSERLEAETIANIIRAQGIELPARYVAGHETSSRVRARHYELWFSSGPIPVE